MRSFPRPPTGLWASAVDAILLTATWGIVVQLRALAPTTTLPPLPAEAVATLGWLIVPSWVAVLAWRGGGGRRIVGSVALALGVTSLWLFLAHIAVNRTLLLSFAAASVPVLVAGRWGVVRIGDGIRRRQPGPRVGLVGDPEGRGMLASALVARSQPRAEVAFAATTTAEAVDRLRDHPVDEVWVAGAPTDADRAALAAACDAIGVPLCLDATFVGVRTASATLVDRGGWTAIWLHPDRRGIDRFGKRILDLVGAVVGLVIFAPLLAVLAAWIRLHDGGPALFVQHRVGRYGRPFPMIKLRTMVVGAQDRLDEVTAHNEVEGPAFKMHGDPRVTRLGIWLRRLSLDELPQLVNVLRGEMSLVGPRPPLPEEVARYARWQRRRLSVKPGMTGLWQVQGRAEESFDRWVALDLHYIDNWSLGLDLVLLVATVPAVLRGSGAR